jgi:hypothetical protein
MTLKEKFEDVEWINEDSGIAHGIENEKGLEECEEIADDYAIEFIEWCGLRTVQITKSEWSNWLPNADGSLSTKELLQIFKNEKKL